MLRSAAICLTLLPLLGEAQTSAFEVATVKPFAPDSKAGAFPPLLYEIMAFRGGPGSSTPNRIDYSGATLKMLLQKAYDLKPSQISGPEWIGTERYDIVALLPAGSNADDLKSMLQSLLNERFQIQFHRQSKKTAIYELMTDKNGPKLEPAQVRLAPDTPSSRREAVIANLQKMMTTVKAQGYPEGVHPQSFSLGSATLSQFADKLVTFLDRPVVDKTGTEGKYALTLNWTDDPLGPSIFTALQEQLGLRLQSRTEEIQILVIDKAEKVPAAN